MLTLRIYKTIDSTQKLIKTTSSDIFIALKQQQGYGRLGSTWISNGLTFSYITNDPVSLICDKICSALRIMGIDCYRKWPNDIMVRFNNTLPNLFNVGDSYNFKYASDVYSDCKVGGVIVEIRNEFSVAGVGLNIDCQRFLCSLKKYPQEVGIDDNKNEYLKVYIGETEITAATNSDNYNKNAKNKPFTFYDEDPDQNFQYKTINELTKINPNPIEFLKIFHYMNTNILKHTNCLEIPKYLIYRDKEYRYIAETKWGLEIQDCEGNILLIDDTYTLRGNKLFVKEKREHY